MAERRTIILIRPLSGVFDALYRVIPIALLAICRRLDLARYEVIIVDQTMPGWRERLREALRGDVLLVGITCLTGYQIYFGRLVARFETGTCRRRIRYHLTDHGGGQLYAYEKDYHENDDRADDIAGDSRRQYGRSRVERLVHERPRIVGVFCRASVVLTEHFHKAAKRNKADTVFCFAGYPFAAKGEAQHALTRLVVFFRKDLRQYPHANA